MNLVLEKGERVTMEGKCRGETISDAEEVIELVADAPTMNSLEKCTEHLVDGGWPLDKWRYCWLLVGLMWPEVRKPSLSTCL